MVFSLVRNLFFTKHCAHLSEPRMWAHAEVLNNRYFKIILSNQRIFCGCYMVVHYLDWALSSHNGAFC